MQQASICMYVCAQHVLTFVVVQPGTERIGIIRIREMKEGNEK